VVSLKRSSCKAFTNAFCLKICFYKWDTPKKGIRSVLDTETEAVLLLFVTDARWYLAPQSTLCEPSTCYN
jgi:hypothetical protein